MSHSCPLQHKRAPRAEPEEDVDVPEPAIEDEMPPENKVISRSETADATKPKNQESTRIQEKVTELEQVAKLPGESKTWDEFNDLQEDASLSPVLPSDLVREECFEGFSSPQGEGPEWISDDEIISDRAENGNVTFSDLQNTEPQEERLGHHVDPSEDMAGEDVADDENIPEMNSSSILEEEMNKSRAASDGINSTHEFNSLNVCAVCSPPFADESEAEEEVSRGITPCLQQFSTLNVLKEHVQLPSLTNVSVLSKVTPALPEVPLDKQQNELLSRSQSELVPREGDQEETQQVHDQDRQPLSTVAMEPFYWGGATFYASGCGAAFKESRTRAGKRTEVESKQTGEEEKQNRTSPGENKVTLQQHSIDLRLLIDKPKPERDKHKPVVSKEKRRMESDSSDSSLSDSGVSADSSRSSSVEGKTTVVIAPKETPIEREIRRSIEREQSLRRSRGLPNVTPPEYVEIPLRNAVLLKSVTTYADRGQGKDRKIAGKKMSHEIHGEFRREKDLVDGGNVLGFYEKSASDQLKERKQLFEAFQTPKEYKKRASAAYSVSTFDNLRGMSLNASEPSASYVTKSHWQSQSSPRRDDSTYLMSLGSGSFDPVNSQVFIHESHQRVPAEKSYRSKTKTKSITVVASARPGKSSKKVRRRGVRASEHRKEVKEPEVSAKENPFFKLRSTATIVKVEQDIREAQQRERELRKQRISLYSSKEAALRVRSEGGVRGRSAASASASSSSSSLSSSSDSDSSSDEVESVQTPRKITGPPAARHSVGKFDVWPPAQVDVERANLHEVFKHTRSTRKSTKMVERWENDLDSSHSEDSD